MSPDEYGDSCRRTQKTALLASPPALLPEIAALPLSRHMQGVPASDLLQLKAR